MPTLASADPDCVLRFEDDLVQMCMLREGSEPIPAATCRRKIFVQRAYSLLHGYLSYIPIMIEISREQGAGEHAPAGLLDATIGQPNLMAAAAPRGRFVISIASCRPPPDAMAGCYFDNSSWIGMILMPLWLSKRTSKHGHMHVAVDVLVTGGQEICAVAEAAVVVPPTGPNCQSPGLAIFTALTSLAILCAPAATH